MINYIQVQSFEHLDELLEQGYTEFSARYGCLSCSREITLTDNPKYPYAIFSYVDGSSAKFTREELIAYFDMIATGNLFAEM